MSFLLSLLCFFQANATAGSTVLFCKSGKTESVHFIHQRFDEGKENSVIDYSNSDFQLNDVARINRRYHEWISAFLSGDLFVYSDEPRSFSLVKDQSFIPYLNSCCLSTCYDMQFLCCLF